MPGFIDITDKDELNAVLSKLKPGTLPLWGKMNAQNMIEHLIENVEYTNGKKIASLEISAEETKKEKLAKIHKDFEIPKNVSGPVTVDLTKIRFKYLQTAIDELNKEVNRFEMFFKQAGQTSVHGAFGPMNYEEWILWHGKHFAHHFMQFGLME